MDAAARPRRPAGAGSVYRRSEDGRWVGTYRRQGLRRYVYGKSRREVERRVRRRVQERPLQRGVLNEQLRAMSIRIVERVIQRAIRKAWLSDFTARVIVASLTPSRVRAGVSGPCFYCGDELATTVDHLVPRSRGGTDDQSNLTSACHMCNSRKGDLAAAEFIARLGWLQ